MTPDLQALAERLDADPRDAVSIQALADYLEERGADAATVRALTVDGPTALIFSHPDRWCQEARHNLQERAERIVQFLQRVTGHEVLFVIAPSSVTVRQIRAQVKS